MVNTKLATLLSVLLGTATSVWAQDGSWQSVVIPGACSFRIPTSTMEIQGGAYKQFNDGVRKVINIESSPNRVVIQPKGINDFDSVALKRYCRIIVETVVGAKGDHDKIDKKISFTPAALAQFDAEIKRGELASMASVAQKGMVMKLLEWGGTKVVTVNGVDMLMTTYRRTMNDAPPVAVRAYRVFNNDRIHVITMSYREAERALWEKDQAAVLSTLKFEKQ